MPRDERVDAQRTASRADELAHTWRLEPLPIQLGFVTRARTLGSAGGDVFVLDPSAHAIRRLSLTGTNEIAWPVNIDVETALEQSPDPDVVQLSDTTFAVVASLTQPFRDHVLLLDERSTSPELVAKPTWPEELGKHAGWVACARAIGGDLYWLTRGTVLAAKRTYPWKELHVQHESESARILDIDGDENGPIARLELRHTGPDSRAEYALIPCRDGERSAWLGEITFPPGDPPVGFFALRSTAVVHGRSWVRTWDEHASAWVPLAGISGSLQGAWRSSAESAVFAVRDASGESICLLRGD